MRRDAQVATYPRPRPRRPCPPHILLADVALLAGSLCLTATRTPGRPRPCLRLRPCNLGQRRSRTSGAYLWRASTAPVRQAADSGEQFLQNVLGARHNVGAVATVQCGRRRGHARGASLSQSGMGPLPVSPVSREGATSGGGNAVVIVDARSTRYFHRFFYDLGPASQLLRPPLLPSAPPLPCHFLSAPL